jgi:hypothetical protein
LETLDVLPAVAEIAFVVLPSFDHMICHTISILDSVIDISNQQIAESASAHSYYTILPMSHNYLLASSQDDYTEQLSVL